MQTALYTQHEHHKTTNTNLKVTKLHSSTNSNSRNAEYMCRGNPAPYRKLTKNQLFMHKIKLLIYFKNGGIIYSQIQVCMLGKVGRAIGGVRNLSNIWDYKFIT